jgi:hypothetical protein
VIEHGLHRPHIIIPIDPAFTDRLCNIYHECLLPYSMLSS